MVGAEGLGDEARQAQRAAQGQGRRCTQARRYSASDVDRWNRVQLVQDGGYRVASITGSRDIAGNDVPAGTGAVVRSPDFLRAPERATALATLIHQRRLTPSCGGHAPTAERTVGPARMIVESLTPRSGIREQYRHFSDLASRPEEFRLLVLSGSTHFHPQHVCVVPDSDIDDLHSITSSARANNIGGIVRSSALRSLEIDDELERGWRLNGQIARLLALKDAVDVRSRPSELVNRRAAPRQARGRPSAALDRDNCSAPSAARSSPVPSALLSPAS